jgi:ABC-type bacteriocin/lantibiotic exporter with double-glycine peptidase domain
MNKQLFIKQRDQTDCGVACLLSVIRHYGGDTTIELLREQSGTSVQGTSLLGLQQAAGAQNLQSDAFEVEDLEVFKREATFPCILHVTIDNQLEHYVVCLKPPFPAGAAAVAEGSGMGLKLKEQAGNYAIIDPAHGFDTWSEEQLLERWKSRAVLLFEPTPQFEQVKQTNNRKITWIKDLVREDTPLLTVAVVLGIVIAVLSMATAVFSQKLIDVILPNKQLTKLWLGIGLLAFLLVAKAGISFLRTYFLIRQSKDFNSRLMGDFYGKLLALPKLFFDTRKIGDITARINDTRRIQSVISYLVGSVVIDALVVIISTAFVFIYSWQVGLIALSSIPFYAFLVWKYNPKIIEAQRNVMRNYAMTESHFVDAIGGVGAIKSGNKTPFFTQIGTTIYNFFQEQVFTLGTIGNRYNVINEIFNGLLVSSVLAYCSFMVLNADLQLGEMMAILSIAVGMVGAIARLATTNIQLQEAKVAFDRMYEFAALKPEEDNTSESTKMGG